MLGKFFGGLLTFAIVVFLILDAILAIVMGINDGWQTGLLIGAPVYVVLCLSGPIFWGIGEGIIDMIKDKIDRGKKYQY